MAVLQLEDVPCCAALGRLRTNGTSMTRNLVLVAILWSYNPERPQGTPQIPEVLRTGGPVLSTPEELGLFPSNRLGVGQFQSADALRNQ